jgi:hypothetical protein
MTEDLTRAELETRIAEVSENLRTLIEQAAAVSGAADEERIDGRIEEQQQLYELLVSKRDAIDQAE